MTHMDHVGEDDFLFSKIAKKKGLRRPLFYFLIYS
jgi:hypothetical protein